MKIEIRDIRKNYGKRQILRGVSLDAAAGQCIGILGVNGSGKSTLFEVLCGLRKAKGQFLLDGVDLLKDSRLRSRLVSLVPQSPPLLEELSARDNLLLWYAPRHMEESLEQGSLRMLGVHEFLRMPVHKMSGGMKKRLAIGCAMAGEPRVLLLDEPTSALDLVCKEAIYRYLRQFQEQGGIVILATHDVYELQLCDTVHVLLDGVLQPYEGRRLAEDFIGCLKHD